MNNNQDNLNQPLNVIPNMKPNEQNENNDTHTFDNDFINRGNNINQNSEPLNVISGSIIPNLKPEHDNNEEEQNPMLISKKNKFINSDFEPDTPSLNSLNIENGHREGPRIDYSKDPVVRAKMEEAKKNTVTVTSEGIIFIVIIQ